MKLLRRYWGLEPNGPSVSSSEILMWTPCNVTILRIQFMKSYHIQNVVPDAIACPRPCQELVGLGSMVYHQYA